MGSVREYFGNIKDALVTTVKGMAVTGRHFVEEPPITVMYPHERQETPPSYRGLHILEQEKCIDCHLCAKACPVDCIEIEAIHHGRVLEWKKFSIDYKKCIFCEFCIPPCPVDCIHMTSEYELATDSPPDMIEDLLTWTGLRNEDVWDIQAAEAKKEGRAPPPKPGQPEAPAGEAAAPAASKPAAGGDDMAAKIAAIKAKMGKKS